MAGVRVGIARVGNVGTRAPVDPGFAVGPFDDQAFLFEQAFAVGDQFAQALERRRVFENCFFM